MDSNHLIQFVKRALSPKFLDIISEKSSLKNFFKESPMFSVPFSNIFPT